MDVTRKVSYTFWHRKTSFHQKIPQFISIANFILTLPYNCYSFGTRNLKVIAQLNDIPDTTKKEIASILETRSIQGPERNGKKRRRKVNDTSSIDSSK